MRISIFLFFCIVCSNINAVANDYEFAHTLNDHGYVSLARKYFEKALANKVVPRNEMDDVYLNLFKLYEKAAHHQADDSKKSALKAKAKSYFSKISDKDNAQTKLEIVKASLSALRKLEADIKKEGVTENEKREIREQAKKNFKGVSEVANKVRIKARDWLKSHEKLSDKERKRQKREANKQRLIEGQSSLQFGEACVLYAAIMGHKNAEVRKWLLKMSSAYQEFIAKYYGSGYAMIAGIYQGEVYILLEKFKDSYDEMVDGVEEGMSSFSDSISAIQDLRGNDRWRFNWIVKGYQKQANALRLINRKELAIQSIDEMFEWKPIDAFTLKKNKDMHLRFMQALKMKCELLFELYKSGKKDVINELALSVTQGFNVCKKQDSPYKVVFKNLLAELPKDDNIKLTKEVAFFKANDLFNGALVLKSEGKKQASLDSFFKASLLYKRAIGLVMLEENKKSLLALYPESAYKMGVCYYELGNYLLALGTFLRTVDLFPSETYSKQSHPDIYKYVRKCALRAKASASKRFKENGKARFDQSLYEMTLKVMSEKFPEEGGNPEYWLGILKKSVEEYDEAKKRFEKIGPENTLYVKSRYHIADCMYKSLLKKNNSNEIDDKTLDQLVQSFQLVVDLASKKMVKPKTMKAKDFEILKERNNSAKINARGKIARLNYANKRYDKARQIYYEIYKDATSSRAQSSALSKVLTCDYRKAEVAQFGKMMDLYKKIKIDDEFKLSNKNKNLANYQKMYGNLIIKNEINPLKNNKENETVLKKKYIQVADLYMNSLKISRDKDQALLEKVIGYYFSTRESLPKALSALELYFKWFPELPELEAWYESMIGKSEQDWDQKIGGYLPLIKHPKTTKEYKQFLDLLFDETAYGQVKVTQIDELVEKSGDQPRNYKSAMDMMDQFEKSKSRDRNFLNKVWPQLKKLRSKIDEANNYYKMRYIQARCLSQLERYGDAAEVFKSLSKYYVQYVDIRIELAKSQFAQGTMDGYGKAEKLFEELTRIIPTPTQVGSYKPKDYFALNFWNARAKLAQLGDSPKPDDVLKIWMRFRSAIYLDLLYIAKNEKRFKDLNISVTEKGAHEDLINMIMQFADNKIFPVLKKTNDKKLKNDSWDLILEKVRK